MWPRNPFLQSPSSWLFQISVNPDPFSGLSEKVAGGPSRANYCVIVRTCCTFLICILFNSQDNPLESGYIIAAWILLLSLMHRESILSRIIKTFLPCWTVFNVCCNVFSSMCRSRLITPLVVTTGCVTRFAIEWLWIPLTCIKFFSRGYATRQKSA